jgi:hypothetical protein
MTVFSKYAYPEDQEVADMEIHCELSEGEWIHMYYLDDELRTESGLILPPDITSHNSHFNWVIHLMRERYEWYYGQEYNDVMKHIKIHKGNKLPVLRAIYEEMDYPLLRDARCPYRCDGCAFMKICSYCSAPVSLCQATKNTSSIVTYFCDDECWGTYFRAKYDKLIQQNRGENMKMLLGIEVSIRRIEYNLTGSRQLIQLKGMSIRGKTVIQRKELEGHLQTYKLDRHQIELKQKILEAFLARNKSDYEKYFAQIKEVLSDMISNATTSQECFHSAKEGKEIVEGIEQYADAYFPV